MQNPDLSGADDRSGSSEAVEKLEKLGFGVGIFGADRRLALYNRAFARLVEGPGCTLAPGVPADAIYTPVANGAMTTSSGASPFGQVERWQVPSGRELTALCTLLEGGGMLCALCGGGPDNGARDDLISHRLTGFLARLGHELRNPLSGILGVASLLERSNLDDKQRAHVAVIRESGNLLLRLVGDLMDLSRLERQDFQLMPEATDLRHLIESCIDLAQSSADDKGLTLQLQLQGAPLPRVMVDPTRLKQVMMNLISNAVKYTEHGEIVVTLDTRRDAQMLDCTFVVRDTGVGIAEEDLGAIFDEFSQIRGSAKRVDGLGLGLPICRRLVEEMGGRIEISSVLGQGTRAEVSLPLPLAD